jgi:hypothetical protein
VAAPYTGPVQTVSQWPPPTPALCKLSVSGRPLHRSCANCQSAQYCLFCITRIANIQTSIADPWPGPADYILRTADLARILRTIDTLPLTVMLVFTVWGLDTGSNSQYNKDCPAAARRRLVTICYSHLYPYIVTLSFVRATGGQAPLVPLPADCC